MNSATKLNSRFKVGDWVTYPGGFRKVLAQVAEDRGPVGMQGRRLYQLRIDAGEEGGTTIEMPEADLELPPAITSADAARKNGLSTQNWPRQGFHIAYEQKSDTNVWRVSLKPVVSWAIPPIAVREGSVSAGGVLRETVRVDLEYDPRLGDPQTSPEIWTSLTKKASEIGDAVFKAKHPNARIRH
jgi:hypothetical protein